MDICYRCGEKIDDITDFTIDRKESWLLGDDPAQLFYDMDNIAFSHARCNYEAGTKTFVSNYKNSLCQINLQLLEPKLLQEICRF
ncbi:hypothetical protein [Sporomusa malonica]|nr:hypothetical protein [Sporomusa malonica]